ncbi:MAG: glycosyltransferase family 39 protein [Chthoniobacterales bacterium]|nr:glycosyltransferase family 39 protein [Chthoniobacterales bacterium]
MAIVLLTIAIRLPSLLHPAPIDDEAVYSVVANEVVDGGRPYVDAVERKPPLLFWTYASVFEVAGKFNWRALHAVALLWTLGTMAGLYAIGRGLFDRATGLVAALLYSLFQAWGTWKNLAFNGEMLMNLPIVWAWAIAFRRTSRPWRPELFAAGVLLCAAFLLKQPAAIAAVPLGFYLLLPNYRASRGLTWTASLIHAGSLTLGFFGALSVVALVLWKQSILGDAFYWSVTNHSIAHFFWDRGIRSTLIFFGECMPLLIAAVVSWRNRRGIWAERSAERTALTGLCVVSAIGATAGARFYPHYYIQLLPPLALLAAPYFARLWSGKMAPQHWLLRPRITQAWLALTVMAFAVAHLIGLVPQKQPSQSGRYLREHSSPKDRIFVWGQDSSIYLEARRRPACRYILTFPLTGYVFGGPLPGVDTRKWILPGAWSTLQQDFAKHPPAYILALQTGSSARYPVRDFPILANLLAEQYEQVAQTKEGAVYRMRSLGPKQFVNGNLASCLMPDGLAISAERCR